MFKVRSTCPVSSCGASDSPGRLAPHLAAAHGWPVTGLGYTRAHRIPVPVHALRGGRVRRREPLAGHVRGGEQ
jgi:hypothetical protein